MSAETIIALWKDARGGLIEEVERIPEDKFSFKATPDTRSIAEVLQHIISAQKMLVSECCRSDANLMRQSFAAHAEEYGRGVNVVTDKNGLIGLLRSSMDEAAASISSYGDKLDETMMGMTGKPITKSAFLTFAFGHEMYHRGQLTVFERLLSIEPALTERFRRLTASAG